MLETLLIAVIVLPIVVVANRSAGSERPSALLAIVTLGLVNIRGIWHGCAAVVERLSFAETPSFGPDKPVHRTAAFLLILGFLLMISNFLIGEAPGESDAAVMTLEQALPELLSSGALHLAAALLGVGWLMRRRLPDVMRRLCLRMPTLREAGISIAVGLVLWLLTTAAVAVWEASVPAEVYQRQTETARQYSDAFSASLAAALLLAVVPAITEETFYRGALQPVFGIFLSSLFFIVTHTQYGLTPATLILFGVSLGFAWLRFRYHTSAAIIAHAVFNFMPYLAGVWVAEQ